MAQAIALIEESEQTEHIIGIFSTPGVETTCVHYCTECKGVMATVTRETPFEAIASMVAMLGTSSSSVKCFKCQRAETPRVEFRHVRHAAGHYGGHASKHQHSSIGIG